MGKRWDRAVSAIRTTGALGTVYQFLGSQAAAVYLWGPALTAWAFIAGWFEQVATPYLVASCAFTFGAVNWGLRQFSLWKEHERVYAKLVFDHIEFFRDLKVQDRDVHISSVQYGVVFASYAQFPIDVATVKIDPVFDSRVPRNPSSPLSGQAMIGRPSLFKSARIEFDPPLVIKDGTAQRFNGSLNFSLDYGRNRRTKHSIAHRIKVELLVDAMGGFRTQFNWAYDDP